MYLIQKQKHKKYQPDDWFQLINSLHEFLNKASCDSGTPEYHRRNTDDFISQLESEIKSLKIYNEQLQSIAMDREQEVTEFQTEKKQLKDEINFQRSKMNYLKEESAELKSIVEDLKVKIELKQSEIDSLEDELDDYKMQL